jgi:hypothetical protein
MAEYERMNGAVSRPPRIAVMTFTYEGDRAIAFDLLESLVASCKHAELDLFLTDDASPSHVGDAVKAWAAQRGIPAVCVRNERNQGFRGAIERTVQLLRTIAQHPKEYDLILRIDTDALVIREGIDLELAAACRDPMGLYGVIKYMRPRDRVGFVCDLLPVGLKRRSKDGFIERDYELRRLHPVWWWKIGVLGIAKGFNFGFVEGSCYALGGGVPRALLERGFLGAHSTGRHGLLTSEEDIIVTMMCRAAGLPIYHLDQHDRSWRDVNTLGSRVLERSVEEAPFVVHALKPNEQGAALRRKIMQKFPLFRAQPFERAQSLGPRSSEP